MFKAYFQGILFSVGLVLATCCSEYEIKQCVNSFTASAGTHRTRTVQELSAVCDSHYPALRRCLSIHEVGCSLQMRELFEGISNTYGYICNEGKEDAFRYGDCLSKSSLVSDIKRCETDEKSKIESDLLADRETLCGYADEYFNCVHDAAKLECGSGAAQFEKKLARLEAGPPLESIGCEQSLDR